MHTIILILIIKKNTLSAQFKLKYQNRRKRRNRYPFTGLVQPLQHKVAGLS